MLITVFYHASCFFLIIDLNYLICAVTAQIFNIIAELVIPIKIPTEEVKTEMEMHTVTVETKITKCLM